MHDPDQHIRLGEAAKIAPGRPSTNCLWRWCRKGVLARSGERVRLQHIRIGGKIFTTAAWLEQFGRALAEADSAHFDLDGQGSKRPKPARPLGRFPAPFTVERPSAAKLRSPTRQNPAPRPISFPGTQTPSTEANR